MDYQEKTLEFGKLVARARKAGLVRADYADHGIVILQLKPKPPDAEPPPPDSGNPKSPDFDTPAHP